MDVYIHFWSTSLFASKHKYSKILVPTVIGPNEAKSRKKLLYKPFYPHLNSNQCPRGLQNSKVQCNLEVVKALILYYKTQLEVIARNQSIFGADFRAWGQTQKRTCSRVPASPLIQKQNDIEMMQSQWHWSAIVFNSSSNLWNIWRQLISAWQMIILSNCWRPCFCWETNGNICLE